MLFDSIYQFYNVNKVDIVHSPSFLMQFYNPNIVGVVHSLPYADIYDRREVT